MVEISSGVAVLAGVVLTYADWMSQKRDPLIGCETWFPLLWNVKEKQWRGREYSIPPIDPEDPFLGGLAMMLKLLVCNGEDGRCCCPTEEEVR